MRKAPPLAALTLALAATAVHAETVHQTVPGKSFLLGDGSNAVAKGKAESKDVSGAKSGAVTRVKGEVNQWGFVTAWFGIPTPAGNSIVRLRVYVDKEKPAKFMVYVNTGEGQINLGELKIPADATPETFVDVDVPVKMDREWSGFTIKKAEKSDLPGPWIDQVSVILAE